jgi:GDPmannose 4,6-dehydratase
MVTGICGQDGGYVAGLLIEAQQDVLGILHPREKLPRHIQQLTQSGRLELEYCDLSQPADFRHLLRRENPERVFHLAAVSHPLACAQDPLGSRQVNVVSVEVVLDWLKREQPEGRVLLSSSAAVFGRPEQSPQSEQLPSAPVNEYGRQKAEVRRLAAEARADGLFAACAIPFNHESERRSEDFVVPKVCFSAARIAAGFQQGLPLGDLEAQRDWGYAPEFAQALAWMLDVEQPLELVLATGEAHSVGKLAELAFAAAGLDWQEHVTSDQALLRRDDTPALAGDAGLAWRELGWEAGTKLPQLARILVEYKLVELKG